MNKLKQLINRFSSAPLNVQLSAGFLVIIVASLVLSLIIYAPSVVGAIVLAGACVFAGYTLFKFFTK